MTDAPNTGSPPAQNTPAATPAASAVPFVQTSDFTPAQLKTLANDAVARGSLTPEQANAMLTVDGVDITPDSRTSAAQEIDAQFPAAQAHEFQLPNIFEDGEKYDAALDMHVRGWMTDARMTRDEGSYIAKEIANLARQNERMSDVDRALNKTRTMNTLSQLWGSEAQGKIALAKQLIGELEAKRPGLKALLDETGAGNNAMVIAHFAKLAERLRMRQG